MSGSNLFYEPTKQTHVDVGNVTVDRSLIPKFASKLVSRIPEQHSRELESWLNSYTDQDKLC